MMDTISSLISTILPVVGLGFVVSFSPVLYVAELAALTQSKRPVYQTLVLIFSILTPILILVLLFSLIIEPTRSNVVEDIGKNSLSSENFPWLDIAFGIIFLVVSMWYFISHKRKPKKKLFQKLRPLNKGKAIYWFGVTKTLISLSGLAALYVAMKLIKQSSADFIAQLVLVLILLVATITPFIAFLLLHLYAPDKFKHIQKLSDKLSLFDYRKATGAILLGVGVLLLGSALWKVLF